MKRSVKRTAQHDMTSSRQTAQAWLAASTKPKRLGDVHVGEFDEVDVFARPVFGHLQKIDHAGKP